MRYTKINTTLTNSTKQKYHRHGSRLTLGGDGLSRVMYLEMFVVIRLSARSLAADVARERPDARMHFQMFGQIVASVEALSAVGHLTHELLLGLVLPHVSLAIVLPYELASAVVARVRPDGLVGVHVRCVIRLAYEGTLAQVTFERFTRSVCVRPRVQFQIPLCGEILVAYDARVRLDAHVRLHMHLYRRFQIHVIAQVALDVLAFPLLVRNKVVVVGASHVPRQRSHVDELFVAMKTRLGLVVVYFLVPRQLLLGVKHLAAGAHVIADPFLHLKV
jgi:hypothetical protein